MNNQDYKIESAVNYEVQKIISIIATVEHNL